MKGNNSALVITLLFGVLGFICVIVWVIPLIAWLFGVGVDGNPTIAPR